MQLFENAPRNVLEQLLPSRVSDAEVLQQDWGGGTLSCKAGYQVPLATKADVALLLTASRDGEYNLITPSASLPRTRLRESLTRCVRTTITIETDGGTETAQLLQEFHDPGPREAFRFRWSPALAPHVEALAGRACGPEAERMKAMETKGPVRQTISPEEASRLLAPTDGNRAFSEKQVSRLKEDIIDNDKKKHELALAAQAFAADYFHGRPSLDSLARLRAALAALKP